jgi:hypothetical protein
VTPFPLLPVVPACWQTSHAASALLDTLWNGGGVCNPSKARISYGVRAPVFLRAFFTPLFPLPLSEARQGMLRTDIFSTGRSMLE